MAPPARTLNEAARAGASVVESDGTVLSTVLNVPTADTQTTVGAAGAASAAPVPLGYAKIKVNGVVRVIAYYNP